MENDTVTKFETPKKNSKKQLIKLKPQTQNVTHSTREADRLKMYKYYAYKYG